jgi:hypothetical protein
MLSAVATARVVFVPREFFALVFVFVLLAIRSPLEKPRVHSGNRSPDIDAS